MNNHSASTHEIGIEIWALGQNIFSPQFSRPSPKFWKIAGFKSAICPLLELQMRWIFFWNCVFLKEEFRYAIGFFLFCAKIFRNWSKSRRPEKEKKIPTCAKESALIPDVRTLQQTRNQNTQYSSRTQNHFYINCRPLRGGNLLWASSIQNNFTVPSLASTHTYILKIGANTMGQNHGQINYGSTKTTGGLQSICAQQQ